MTEESRDNSPDTTFISASSQEPDPTAQKPGPLAHVFGKDQWQRFYPEALQPVQEGDLPSLPWDNATLLAPCPFHEGKKVGETHFAFLAMERWGSHPLTLSRWGRLHPRLFNPRSFEYWCQEVQRPFTNHDTCQLGWYLAVLDVGEKRRALPYHQQWDLLPPGYLPPTAVEAVTFLILLSRLQGNARFNGLSIWTRDSYGGLPERRILIEPKASGVRIESALETGKARLGLGAFCKFPEGSS